MLIQQISAEATWHLRHTVMWPEAPIEFVKLPEDEKGVHFGAYVNDKIVSVVSLFLNGTQAQFRKFATATAEQGKGYGTILLQHVFLYAQQNNVKVIWCDARENKADFYTKFGMRKTGSPFTRNGKQYVRMEKLFEKVRK